jgi:hypothetical protein
MKKSLLFRIVVIVIAFLGSYSVAQAQVTTSSITGTVKDAKGPMPGASVRAVHVPTGTVYGITTNNDGRFTLGNARVGGPYTIEVSFVGYAPQKFENVFLRLGEPYVLNVVISDNASNLNEVTIRGTQANSLMSSNRSGSSTVLTRASIQSLPTISRSVNDLTRLTPQANGQSIGGGNYRSNNFSVDGANFNNQFGIGQNVPANGSPISIDALEQISINVTPYDVRQSGFTGGSINAVTRSGTNKFFGNAFVTTRGEEQQGRRIGDYKIPNSQVQSFDEKNYGFSFGGPIIKDKLFFFINAEKQLTTAPGTSRIASTPGLPYGSVSTVTNTSAGFMDQVKSYLLNNLGYDPGIYQGYSNVSNNEKLFARLDWNISKNHRFSVRYNQVESETPSSASTSVSGSGVTGVLGYGNNRSGNNQDAGLPFSNSNYATSANLYSGVAELNSTFGSRFTNVLRATYSHQNDPRTSQSALFPLVDILDGTQSATSAGKVLTTFGYEPFTYGNLRDVKTYTYSDDLSIALGKHNLTLGAQAEYSTTQNGFQRFGTGFYTFASWADFENRATVKPLQYSVTYPLTADGSQAFPSFKFAQYSAYLQDEFNVSDRLKLTGGLRIEQATYPDVSEIRTHPLVLAQTFANGEHIDTGALPDAKMTFSPRFGFNWDVSGDRSLVVRGGSGIFTGRVPFVWIVAQSGDAGLLQYTQTYSGANTPFFNPSIAPNLTTPAPAAGVTMPSTLSAISPNLKFPQTWKSSLAVDVKLPLGLVGTIEGIYGKDLNVAFAKNVNLKDPAPLNNPASADNRPFFAPSANARQYVNTTSAGAISATGTTANNVIEMVNAKGGYNWQATAQLTKTFTNGLGLMIAYTRSDQRNFGDQGGDQLLNLWSIPQTSTNPNTPTLSYSGNLNPDRIIANISYRKEYLGNLATSFSLFYEGSQQGRFSYTYSADFNRDGQTNDLIYIPRDASEITFVPLTIGSGANVKNYSVEQQSQIFQDYINQDDYLSKHRGEYAKRNAATSPWRNQFDLRIVQEVFKNIGNSKNSFQFTADIFNVGNLLNRNWGNRKFVNNASILVPQNVALISETVKPTFKLAQVGGDVVRSTFGTTQTITSTYNMQFGVRYNFN